jgi:hypothetical protein
LYELQQVLSMPPDYGHEPFCERLLMSCFGATSVVSFDNSDFEGATFIHDFNKPLGGVETRYNTVLDLGTSEHVYNIAQALKNISCLCKDDGQIIHFLPGNGFCGHGFWQISPELFFSLYSNKNGYRNTKVWLLDWPQQTLHEMQPPEKGGRHSISECVQYMIVCRTVKTSDWSHDDVQQSDYTHLWNSTTKYQ